MNKAERIAKYGVERYEQLVERIKIRKKERYHNDADYRKSVIEQTSSYIKDRYNNDPVFKDKYREYQKEYQKKPEVKEYYRDYKKNDLNLNGRTKDSIRVQSNHILFKQRKHTKLKDYEIHHCFGYEDPSKFIYIPRSLHKAIHRFLKENNINADTDHYKYISAIINECTEYTYISA